MNSNVDYSRLEIKTDNNIIINLEDILSFLDELELDDNLVAYLESLQNRLQNSSFENKEALINAVSSKLIEYKMQGEEELSNRESLREIQAHNEDLKKLGIISTSMHDNDSGKDMEYITFKKDDGTVEMLACHDTRAISSFINSRPGEIASRSAEEIFNYFKEYIHRDVRFMKPEKLEQDYPEVVATARVNDEHIKDIELKEMQKYKDKYDIPFEIEEGIDFEGERLYRLGDGIFKFKTTSTGRQMVVLQTPTLKNIEQQDLNPEQEMVEEEPNVSVNPEDNADSLVRENDFVNLTLEEFRSLVYDRDINMRILSPLEERSLNMFASYLISTMVERASQPVRDWEVEEVLDDFMANIVDKFQASQNGSLQHIVMSPEEKNLAQSYLDGKKQVAALGIKNNNVKKLEYIKEEERRAGITNIILIIEIAVIALSIINIIAIVK